MKEEESLGFRVPERGGIFKSHGWSDWQEMEVLTNED
jgi:hypothetical protein